MEGWSGPLRNVIGKCRVFYMWPHAEAQGRGAGSGSLCWLLPCLIVRAERQKLVVIEEPGGGGRSLMSEQVGCVRSSTIIDVALGGPRAADPRCGGASR
jgi:hypothetical protein